MMKYKSKITGVHNVCANGNNLILLKDNTVFLNDKEVYTSDLQIHTLGNTGEYFYIICEGETRRRSVIFNQNGDQLISGNFIIKMLDNDFAYISQNGNTKKISFSEKILWEIIGKYFYIYKYKNKFYGRQAFYNLFCIDDNTGQELWRYCSTPKYDYKREITIGDFREEKNDISKIIIEHNGLLWIVLATGILIALDVETGQEKYVLVKPINYTDEYDYSYTQYAKFDSITNHLFGSYGKQYWELDLNDPEQTFLCHDLSLKMKENEVNSISCKAWDGKDRIFFGDTGDNYKIGIFSRSQKTITWCYAIEELKEDSWMSIRQVEYGAGQLYVRDKFNVLHIFEDE